jgi:hypothetical protein
VFERQKIPVESISATLNDKWGRDVLDEGYVVFPKRLLRCLPNIFGDTNEIKELQVCLAVADFFRPDLKRGPSLAFLAFSTSLEEDQIKEIMRGLRSKGLLDYRGTVEELKLSNAGLRAQILIKTAEEEQKPKEIPF